MNVHGVILAGGLATRMGGGDKALRDLAGRTLFERVIERLLPQVTKGVINANGAPERFAPFGLPVIADDIPDHPGPLAGVLAGMEWARREGASHILTVAADTPFFPTDLRVRLEAALTPDAPVALAATPDGRPERAGKMARHPTFGLWPVALRQDLRRALVDEGLRKVVLWTDRQGAGKGTAIARFEVVPFDPFFNVNTPDDMARAEEIAREHRV